MKQLLSTVIVFISLVAITNAQPMQHITGETIDHQRVSIPEDTKGKYTLLCFASSTKAQSDLESWLDPIYQKFIAKTGIMDDAYDVNVFLIPLVKGSNQMFAEKMKKKFSETAQSDLRPHVLFSETNADQIISALRMSQSDVPYMFLLDKDGKIIYQTNGRFTEEKFDAIDDLIE